MSAPTAHVTVVVGGLARHAAHHECAVRVVRKRTSIRGRSSRIASCPGFEHSVVQPTAPCPGFEHCQIPSCRILVNQAIDASSDHHKARPMVLCAEPRTWPVPLRLNYVLNVIFVLPRRAPRRLNFDRLHHAQPHARAALATVCRCGVPRATPLHRVIGRTSVAASTAVSERTLRKASSCRERLRTAARERKRVQTDLVP